MSQTVYKSCRAMATHFELWLVGEDDVHLEAVGQLVMEEIRRVEGLLSRYDPAAEVARLNQEAVSGSVQVSIELMQVLQDAAHWYTATKGYFNVAVAGTGQFEEKIGWDLQARLVQFFNKDVALDLGGYGKGYALDRAGKILERYGITDALMHGGTSSVWAKGMHANGHPWPLYMAPPFEGASPLEWVLQEGGFSCSGHFPTEGHVSDLINPHTGQPLTEAAICAVFAPTALAAEVWSTAFLMMGRETVRLFLQSNPGLAILQVAWLHPQNGEVEVSWLHPTS